MYNIDLANVKSIVADIVAKHNVENVAFVGCGASKAELYPAKYFLANCSKKLRVAHYTANEFNYDTPDWLGDTTVVITASLGGSTPETVKANSVAKAAGATVVSVTHAAGSALTKEADLSVLLELDFVVDAPGVAAFSVRLQALDSRVEVYARSGQDEVHRLRTDFPLEKPLYHRIR